MMEKGTTKTPISTFEVLSKKVLKLVHLEDLEVIYCTGVFYVLFWCVCI